MNVECVCREEEKGRLITTIPGNMSVSVLDKRKRMSVSLVKRGPSDFGHSGSGDVLNLHNQWS